MFKKIIDFVDTPIDYAGQKRADTILFYTFIIGYSISLLVGFLLKNLFYTLIIGIITVSLASILVIPSWFFYKRNPVKFIEEKEKKD
ncbi:microsomal signal peptidase Spc12 [Tubulinosema ratisbonensis]|uniref:Signal peptidase complex subunit 1 n=1 Tax=Tubulinosema ratisbonensis TaxID=291195 RepID=A0A437ANS6_9MICR|nr:microsomal signal peptidase Spc12 [Tubulinosema ratisbonensis]